MITALINGAEASVTLPKYVLIIALDGATPATFKRAATPHIDRLRENGAYSWRAQSMLPTWSLQCYVGILAGVPADNYELLSDPEGWLAPRTYPVPSIFDLAHEAGLGTAMFNNWPPLHELPRPGTVDTIFSIEPEHGSAQVTAAAIDCLHRDKPNFCFVHFDDPDAAGHEHGWESAEQCAAVTRCDKQVGELLNAMTEAGMRDESLVFILSDHGGGQINNISHGDPEDWQFSHPVNTTVPWICCGPGIKQAHEIRTDVSICDTAATAAHMLNLDIPASWQGKVVWDALTER